MTCISNAIAVVPRQTLASATADIVIISFHFIPRQAFVSVAAGTAL
jgi:branched-subunit amino acid transport protein AzlD